MSKLEIADVKVCRDGQVRRRSDGELVGWVRKLGRKWFWNLPMQQRDPQGHGCQVYALNALLRTVNGDA